MSLKMYREMQLPFKADSVLYLVYNTDKEIVMVEVPTMMMYDEKGDVLCYRSAEACMIAPDISTHFFETSFLNRELQLKDGIARYYISEETAKRVTHNLYAQRVAEISQCIRAFKDILRQVSVEVGECCGTG